jgi:hypothetical protein
MAGITEEEARIGSDGFGSLFKRRIARMIAVDGFSADYLFSKAIANNKTPAEIISEMIREKLVMAQ